METRLIRSLAVLGVPGVALGLFYLLLRTFNFQFAQIGPTWGAVIAILFLFVVGAVTLLALLLWRPTKLDGAVPENSSVMVLQAKEETVTITDLLRSVGHDVVKIDAHTHQLGVAAEYEWKKVKYPESKMIMQRLEEMDVGKNNNGVNAKTIYFDVLEIQLSDGRKKEIYFDISSFFNGGGSSMIDPDSFIAGKIEDIYARK
jgi:hypothetical protein